MNQVFTLRLPPQPNARPVMAKAPASNSCAGERNVALKKVFNRLRTAAEQASR